MKRLAVVLLMLFTIAACTVDNRTEIESPIQERIIDLDIREVDNEDNYLKIETSPNDFIYIHKDSIAKNVAERNNGKGKGKKDKTLVLRPSIAQIAVQGDIMKTPVLYTGELPLDNNNAIVDWDGDGAVDDSLAVINRCFFPKTFSKMVVYIDGTEEVMINNAIRLNTQIVGFVDDNNDGRMDVVLQHAQFADYNNGGTFNEYSIGYNEVGELPLPIDVILSSLVVDVAVNNPTRVTWDLGEGYDFFPTHVSWRDVNAGGLGFSTSTYPEWGVGLQYFPPNTTIEMRFTNAEEPCEDVIITFNTGGQ